MFLSSGAQKQALHGRHVYTLADLQFSSCRGHCHWPHFPSGPPLWRSYPAALRLCVAVCILHQDGDPILSFPWPVHSPMSTRRVCAHLAWSWGCAGMRPVDWNPMTRVYLASCRPLVTSRDLETVGRVTQATLAPGPGGSSLPVSPEMYWVAQAFDYKAAAQPSPPAPSWGFLHWPCMLCPHFLSHGLGPGVVTCSQD